MENNHQVEENNEIIKTGTGSLKTDDVDLVSEDHLQINGTVRYEYSWSLNSSGDLEITVLDSIKILEAQDHDGNVVDVSRPDLKAGANKYFWRYLKSWAAEREFDNLEGLKGVY